MQSRRGFFTGVFGLLGATVTGTAVAAPTATPPVGVSGRVERGSASLELFADLPELGPCRVVRVIPILAGAVPLLLEGPSGEFQVDVCRAGAGSTLGLARGGSLELFVHNGGRGDRQSSPEHVRAVRLLAEELDRRVSAGAEVPDLLTWAERQELALADALVLEVDPSLRKA